MCARKAPLATVTPWLRSCAMKRSMSGSALAWLLALGSQAAGLLAERWFFFAQARHPQNIYYQAVS